MYSFLCELTFAVLLIFVRFICDDFEPFTAAGLFVTVLGYHVQLTYFVLRGRKVRGKNCWCGDRENPKFTSSTLSGMGMRNSLDNMAREK